MFYLPSHGLNHNLTTVLASLATVELWVAANMGPDSTGRDAYGQRNLGAVLSLLEHLMDDSDVLLFHG